VDAASKLSRIPRKPRLVVLAGPIVLAAGLARARPPEMPGPAPPPRTGDRIAAQADCVRCHPDVAREWQDSLHRVSASDEPYREAFAREPLRFCRNCHVPESMPRETAPSAWAEQVGVGCVTCHVTDRRGVLAAPGADAGAHALVTSAAFAGPPACAGCHEFGFPGASVLPRPDDMQETVREHAASWARDYSCADCHMPWVDDGDGRGHRSHRFAASRDPEMLARAVGVSARRSGPAGVEVTLTPGAAGHAFPTGDLFRRLELRVWLIDPEGPRAPQRRRLGREFASGPHGGVMARGEVADNRVHNEPVVLRFDLTAAPASTAPVCDDVSQAWVAWELRYQRVAFPSPRRPDGAALDGEVIVTHGAIPGLDP
jgi:hypothetical protein